MRVVLDLRRKIEENAADYFEKAKKAKKKLKGALETIEKTKKMLSKLEKDFKPSEKVQKEQRKREWYEKFRWFFSSTGFLVIGGRDATTNEIVIKKYTDKNDIVLHTDMAGSPFFVIKSEGKEIDKQTLNEAADATCTFSRAWKLQRQSQDVFYVKPEQVSKEAKSGEYLSKGAFMIYGETKYLDNKCNLCVGIKGNVIMSGPFEAISKNCEKYVKLTFGDEKASSMAKRIRYKLGGELDEIIRSLPAGTFKIV